MGEIVILESFSSDAALSESREYGFLAYMHAQVEK